jgi:hypothetical protein
MKNFLKKIVTFLKLVEEKRLKYMEKSGWGKL